MKVAIVYDRVNKWGGAERVLLTLHELFPKAPLYTSVYDKKNAKWAKVFPEIKTSFLQKVPFTKNNHEFLAPLMPLAFSLHNFDNYDLVISVTSEFAKNINVKKGIHVCYCLTPTRYLWSSHNEYFKNITIRKILAPLINYLKKIDQKSAKKPDIIIAISNEVKKRIKKYYDRESIIIYPPVSTNFPKAKSRIFLYKKYFLVVSRLVKYKRVDLVIEAFNELKLPLVIVGIGRQAKNLKQKAKDNVEFIDQISDKKLANIYKNSKALIFPQKEDFGITAVEAQSHGIPVIAYKAGGALETIIENKTGIFFNKQTKDSLIKAIKKLDTVIFDTKILRKNANKFSKEKFKDEFLQIVKKIC